jgi:hypothetical protein
LQDGYFKLKPNDNFSFIEKSFFQDLIDAMIFLLMIITFAAVSGAVDGVYEKRVSNE